MPAPTSPSAAQPLTMFHEVLRGALFGAVAMAVLQTASPWPTDNDSFYHLRMARELPTMGFAREFPWLHWTIFRDNFVSHHYGFHVLLFPFVWISERLTGDLIWGGKACTIACMAATCGLYSALLRQVGAPRRGLWLLLLACVPWEFWLRMTYIRAPAAALPLLLLATIFALRGRATSVGILAFLFTHLYGGGVIFPLVPLGVLLGAWLALGFRRSPYAEHEQATTQPPPIRNAMLGLATAAGGIVAALAVNPYFPANFSFLYTQIFQTGLAATNEGGNEWHPHNVIYLASTCVGLAAVWTYAIVRRWHLRVPLDAHTLSLLVLNFLFLALTLKARRFIEYWPIFALLSAAAWTGGTNTAPAGPSRFAQRWPRVSGALREFALPAAIAASAIVTLRYARTSLLLRMNVDAIRCAVQFIATNSAPRDLILTDDWDKFPICFYYNRHNTYAVGLDPVFTSARYPDLWERYKRITRAQTPYKLSPELRGAGRPEATLFDIHDVIGAKFVLVLDDHPLLYERLNGTPDLFERVYTTPEQNGKPPAASVFRVRPSPTTGQLATTAP